jgi:hypothetical protein
VVRVFCVPPVGIIWQGGAPGKGARKSSHPCRGAPFRGDRYPGVREKRVPLANLLAPFRGVPYLQTRNPWAVPVPASER